jgi:hypothetical protein
VSGYYSCRCQHDELRSVECPRHVNSRKADEEVWNQICHVIENPDVLLDQAKIMVEELRSSIVNYSADQERIQKELDALISNRQWVITQARKGGITEQEMDWQLSEMSMQEAALKQELSVTCESIDSDTMLNWDFHVRQYLADMQEGITGLRKFPVGTREEREILKLKRQIIETLVEKVIVDRNQQYKVTIRLNLLSILEGVSGNGGGSGSGGVWPSGNQNSRSGIGTRRSGFQTRMGIVRINAI